MEPVIDTRKSRTLEFQSLALEFCALAESEAITVIPYTGDSPRYFADLPDTLQEGVLNSFRAYTEIAREIKAEGESLRNDQIFLWRVFQKMKLRPPSNFMDLIRDGEVIEIHNSEFVQVYRNLNFFSLCSYTLDDLLCRPFWQLFLRDEAVTGKLMELGQRLFSNSCNGVQVLEIGEHTVLEIDSAGRFLSVIQHRLAAPLYDSLGRVMAAITITQCLSSVRTAP